MYIELTNEQLMTEEWKDLVECNTYEISNFGRCRRKSTKRLVQCWPCHNGYLRYHLTHDYRSFIVRVNVAVLRAFVGERPAENYEADHKNKNILDNGIENLRWITKFENLSIAHSKSVRCVETGEIFKSETAAAEWVGVGSMNISNAVNKGWRSGGYHWEFYEGEETK